MANKVKLICEFRVTLLGIEPAVWRMIQVPASYTFWDLHVAIQDSMGWLDYHLHQFQIKKPRGRKLIEIGIPDGESGDDPLPGWKVPISEYFGEPGARAAYVYDFGDQWRHEILLEGVRIRSETVKYPVCMDGERACPPEDCGSISGYQRLLKAIASPGTAIYREKCWWLKNHAKNYFPYRPDHFAPNQVEFSDSSKRLRMLFEHY